MTFQGALSAQDEAVITAIAAAELASYQQITRDALAAVNAVIAASTLAYNNINIAAIAAFTAPGGTAPGKFFNPSPSLA